MALMPAADMFTRCMARQQSDEAWLVVRLPVNEAEAAYIAERSAQQEDLPLPEAR